LEALHAISQRRVGGGEDPDGQQAGIAGIAHRDRGDRYPGGHLDDREQRVEAVEVAQRDRYPDHWQGVTLASMPGRWAAPPAPAMITRRPRAAADSPYSSIS